MVFVHEQNSLSQETFCIKNRSLGSTIVFMPLEKKIIQSLPQENMKKNSSHRIINHDAYQRMIKEQKKSKKVLEKKDDTKSNKTVTSVLKKRSEKQDQKVLESKKVKPLVQESVEQFDNKLVTQKKIKDKQTLMKKTIAPVASKDKKIVPEDAHQQQEDQKPVVEKEKDSQVLEQDACFTQEQAVQQEIINLEDVSFVGRYDLEKYEIEEKIKKAIARHWKAPIGISKSTTCEMVIVVDQEGKVVQVSIKKGSGSIAYDMSSKAAAYQSKFPKEVYGKEFTIVLGA